VKKKASNLSAKYAFPTRRKKNLFTLRNKNIKKCIEEVVNAYQFDKSKIAGIVCDEGSNLVRLFSQLENVSFEANDSSESESENEDDNDDDNGASNDEDDDDGETQEDTVEDLQNSNFEFNDLVATQNLSVLGNFIDPFENVADETEYDFQRGDPITDLELSIGSEKYPRFNCAAHKINLAVRKAVNSSTFFSNLVARCGVFISNYRKSKHLYSKFRDLECTLQRQNFTRWNSTYRMLFGILKAHRAGLFGTDNPCPVPIKDVEIFLQILKPVFVISTDIQSNKSNISIVVPSIFDAGLWEFRPYAIN
jgi:hypothetical protein